MSLSHDIRDDRKLRRRRNKVTMSLLTTAALWTTVLQATAQESYFVLVDQANVRLCPAITCPSTNRVHQDQVVQVFEIRDGWARTSKYYKSSAEREEFPQIRTETVATWMRIDLLGKERRARKPSPSLDPTLQDARIIGIPDSPKHGLTYDDIVLLRKYAVKLLQGGQCSTIDDGDKSTSKPGKFFVHCLGESRNRFFSASDTR